MRSARLPSENTMPGCVARCPDEACQRDDLADPSALRSAG
jgi:hypothetical protein